MDRVLIGLDNRVKAATPAILPGGIQRFRKPAWLALTRMQGQGLRGFEKEEVEKMPPRRRSRRDVRISGLSVRIRTLNME